MRYYYTLRIEGAPPDQISLVLKKPSSAESGHWTFELEEGSNALPIPFVDVFLEFIEDKIDLLEKIGVSRDDITLWYLYEYDDQCNMEFPAMDLKRLGEAGITLCVSCWEAAS